MIPIVLKNIIHNLSKIITVCGFELPDINPCIRSGKTSAIFPMTGCRCIRRINHQFVFFHSIQRNGNIKFGKDFPSALFYLAAPFQIVKIRIRPSVVCRNLNLIRFCAGSSSTYTKTIIYII